MMVPECIGMRAALGCGKEDPQNQYACKNYDGSKVLSEKGGAKWKAAEGIGMITILVNKLEDLKKNLYICMCTDGLNNPSEKGGAERKTAEGIGMLTDLVNKLEDLQNLYTCRGGSEGTFESADDTEWQVELNSSRRKKLVGCVCVGPNGENGGACTTKFGRAVT